MKKFRTLIPKLFLSVETGFGRGATKRTVATPESVIYGVTTASEDFEVTKANVKATLTKPTDLVGDITLSYTITNPRATTASITAQYSTDIGATWNTMTSAGGDDGIDGLATSSGGTAHTFIWDTVTDLGIDFTGSVEIRIKVFDRDTQGGDFEFSQQHKLNINNAPLISTLVSPIDSFFDKNETPTLVFVISDPSEGDSDMHAKLELDTEATFGSDNLITFESRNDQTGWEYDSDGAGSWVKFPSTGIPIIVDNTLVGNQARYTIQTPDRLTAKVYNWRITFGGVTT